METSHIQEQSKHKEEFIINYGREKVEIQAKE
jgi:hypothetical protein